MAKSKAKIDFHPLIGEKDTPEPIVTMVGYLGPAKGDDKDKKARLYTDLTFRSYYEIPIDQICEQSQTVVDDPNSPTRVYIKASAQLTLHVPGPLKPLLEERTKAARTTQLFRSVAPGAMNPGLEAAMTDGGSGIGGAAHEFTAMMSDPGGSLPPGWAMGDPRGSLPPWWAMGDPRGPLPPWWVMADPRGPLPPWWVMADPRGSYPPWRG